MLESKDSPWSPAWLGWGAIPEPWLLACPSGDTVHIVGCLGPAAPSELGQPHGECNQGGAQRTLPTQGPGQGDRASHPGQHPSPRLQGHTLRLGAGAGAAHGSFLGQIPEAEGFIFKDKPFAVFSVSPQK